MGIFNITFKFLYKLNYDLHQVLLYFNLKHKALGTGYLIVKFVVEYIRLSESGFKNSQAS